MKKILLLLLVCGAVNAQITPKGEYIATPILLSDGTNLGLEITYVDMGQENQYVMTFRNRDYHNIIDFRHISFMASPKDLIGLYVDWDKLYDSQVEKKYTLNEATVRVFPKGKDLYFYVSQPGETDSFFYINRKRLAKAFGVTGS